MDQPTSKTGLYLEGIARGLADAINRREYNYDHPDSIWRFVAQDVKAGETYVGADGEGPFYGTGPASVASRWKALTDVNRNLQLHVTSSSSEVDEKYGTATVFLTFQSRGLPGGLVRTSVGVFGWRRHQGQWTCCAYYGMQGGGG